MPKISLHLSEIKPILTAHGEGRKYVFLSNEETNSPITQIAYGQFYPGECCPNHMHPTMEECFFFLKGEGVYTVGERVIKLKPGVFLRIPPGTNHHLNAVGDRPLEFVYWGVATNS